MTPNVLLTTVLMTFGTWAIIKVSGHQHRWSADDYDLEMGHI